MRRPGGEDPWARSDACRRPSRCRHGRDSRHQRRLPRRVRKRTTRSNGSAESTAREGRRPRILVAKMARDGHAVVRRWSPRRTPTSASTRTWVPCSRRRRRPARQAVENDVHIIGMSSLAAWYLLPQLVAELRALGRDDIMVICGGVIPAQDYAFLKEHGAAAIFGRAP